MFTCSLFFFYSSGDHRDLHSFPTRRSSDLRPRGDAERVPARSTRAVMRRFAHVVAFPVRKITDFTQPNQHFRPAGLRSEEHTSELQSRLHLVCRLLLEKKKNKRKEEKIVQ